MSKRLCLSAFVLAYAGCAALAHAQLPAAPESLLFTSNRDAGMFELYLMRPDGKGVQRLLPQREACDIAWSPDGRTAAFTSTHNGNSDIYTVDVASGRLQRLTEHAAYDGTPVWSHDGRSIAFQSYRDNTPKLYVMRADGSGQRRLTEGTAEESSPAFAPDNSSVAYVVKLGRHQAQIRLANLATGKSLTLGSDPSVANEQAPVWSPDGSRLAYMVQKGDTSHIHTMRADGSDKTALTQGTQRSNAPLWSPDGKHLMFLSVRAPSPRQLVYVIGADGKDERLLTPGGDEHLLARWAPDGQRIYFVRFQGRGQIFSMDASGAGPVKLSDNSGYDYEIAVSPQGRMMQRTAAR